MISKTTVNLIMAIIAVGAGLIAYWATDRQPPSHFIAAWVMTQEVDAGGPILVRFILVRHRLCPKRIEQRIEQGWPAGSFPLPAKVIETSELGLDVLTLEETMPTEIASGTAAYAATFIWRCPGNFVHWFKPINKTIELPIIIRRFDEIP